MELEGIKLGELKLSDRLAIERTIMGADRSLLAWVRTSMSLITFGFTIFKVLERVEKSGAARLVREQTPRNIGIFLILVGTFPLALAMFQYKQVLKRLGGKGVYVNPGMLAAAAVFLLGCFLLLVVLMNLDVI